MRVTEKPLDAVLKSDVTDGGVSHGRFCQEKEFVIDNLLVRIHVIIVMIRWTGLAPWEFEFPFPGSLTSTFLSSAKTNEVFTKEFDARKTFLRSCATPESSLDTST